MEKSRNLENSRNQAKTLEEVALSVLSVFNILLINETYIKMWSKIE